MELASNLIWAVTAIALLALIHRGAARRTVRWPLASTMLLALLLCLILLPAISVSDDMLAARQASLPLTGQTWRIVWENASVGLDLLLAVYLLALISSLAEVQRTRQVMPMRLTLAARLIRSQRLRPPLCTA